MLAESEHRMTAEGTAIGGGLAVRRPPHHPPGRRGKPRHAPILALIEGEPPLVGLRRIVLAQLDLAIELQQTEPGDARAVHETRKAIKRARSLLRLARASLGETSYARENADLQEAGRLLAGARDAEVMAATLADLMDRHPRKLATPEIHALHARLLIERTAADTQGESGELALRHLRDARTRLQGWMPGEDEVERAVLAAGLERLRRRGDRRRRAALHGKGPRAALMHEWRKRVKDLRYGAEALGLDETARRARRVERLIGAEHDLAVLGERIEREDALGRRSRKALCKRISRRRRKLRRRACKRGRRLYRRPL
jgi:CHAD domain-containing protein